MNEETLRQIEQRASYNSTFTRTSALELRHCVDLLLTEVRRLRQELRDYGEHDAGCYKKYTETELRRTGWTDAMLADRVCTCGLDAAIDGEEKGNH